MLIVFDKSFLARFVGMGLLAAAALPAASGTAPAQEPAAAPATAAAATSAHTGEEAKPRIDLGPPAESGDFTQPLTHTLNGAYDEYLAFKTRLQDEYNIGFTMPASIYTQWAGPNGGQGNVELVYTPNIVWKPFTDTEIGSGSVDVLFQQYHFWTRPSTGTRLATMGLITQTNAWPQNGYQLTQLTYTHTFPGKWLSIAAGQYTFGQYDDNQYSGDAQTSFINYALAQSGTQTYANAGMGAYAQLNPTESLQFAGGMQSATDITGHAVTMNGFGSNKIAWFASAQWTTTFLGGGTYNIIYYDQPSVPLQPSASKGISFSASQDFDDQYGVFLRVNNASGAAIPIQTSVGFGLVVNDPFDRMRLDQAGIAVAWDKANKSNLGGAGRNAEWIGELYYNYWLFKGMILTPDVQVYVNPVLAPDTKLAGVFTLRTTFQF